MHGEKRPGTGTFLSFVVCVCVCKCVCVCVKGGGLKQDAVLMLAVPRECQLAQRMKHNKKYDI
jgi:hypothetical protein